MPTPQLINKAVSNPILPSSFITRLRKVAAPRPHPVVEAEKCDFCGKTILAEHRHFVDLSQMRFMCTCEMCAVTQAESGIFKPLPQRYLYLKEFDMPEVLWQEFMIPVNMAYFVYNSTSKQTIAFYPAPAGATESKLGLTAWEKLEKRNPVLSKMAPDLEAFLANRLGPPPHEHYIVPIDCCYRLIGLVRASWEGIHGGPEVQEAIRKFFKELKAKSTVCPA